MDGMARRPIRDLVDLVLDGTLDEELTARRKNGDSFDIISRWLSTKGVEVTGETIRTWCNDLGLVRAASSARDAS